MTKEVIDMILRGAITSFIPTVLGAFLGFILGTARVRSSEKKLFYALLSYAFAEMNDKLFSLAGYINLITTGQHLQYSKNPNEFVRLNHPSFPNLSSIVAGGTITRYANIRIWALFLNRISNAQIVHNQLLSLNYGSYDDLVQSYNNLRFMYANLAWSIYCLAINRNIDFTAERYQELTKIIDKAKNLKLQAIRMNENNKDRRSKM